MEIVILAHNIRSTLNLGAIFRTAEGFGVQKIYLSGYTPNWHTGLPHVVAKMQNQIHKTALGAETMVESEYLPDLKTKLAELKTTGYRLVALEQSPHSIQLSHYQPPTKIALLLGEEVRGVEPQFLKLCDDILEIPMRGRKESFNVAVATGIALYHLTQA
jgi:tRNA G18 (ribose-2'-O)-methylase SpoU